MPSVDFYLLAMPYSDLGLRWACRLIEKVYQQRLGIYICTLDAQTAAVLDDLIWTFKDDAFIPHSLYGQSEDRIQIGHDQKPNPDLFHEVLINLTPQQLDFGSQFQRILEPIFAEEKESAREKYNFYREQQYPITTHDLTQS